MGIEKNTLVSTPAPVIVNNGEKPEKFNGTEFKRWQQKILFYLTTLNLARFLHEESPALIEGETDKQVIAAVEAWKHADFLCRNYTLNELNNTLYNVYCSLKIAKELWDSLDKKYKTEDAGMKKFVVGRFLDYKMIDSKAVINQVQELQDFKNYLKHKRKEMKLEDLIVRLMIEEDNRASEKKAGKTFTEAKANVVEQGHNSKKRKNPPSGPKQGPNDNKKFKGKCYVCDKPGHRAKDCRKRKDQGNTSKKLVQANMTELDTLSADVSDINLSAVVSEVNLVGNTREWWVDTEATRHVCSNKEMFSTYQASNGEQLLMGNFTTSKVEGQGQVVLKMTFGKELTLNNVLHVPDIRKNLVSGSLLSKKDFKLVFESNKFVLTKSGMYMGKGYMSDGLFKMNVMTIVPNKKNSSAYMLESSNVWHGRLGHVNYDALRRLVNIECLPKCSFDSSIKCETCVEAKLTRTSFQSIEKTSEPLQLIHSDICDLKFVQTKGGKKYFLTFIDDCTKYYYVYLLRSKDEALKMFKHYKNEVENQLDKKIKVIRSDRGGEYKSPFGEFCSQHGIIHQTTALYSPQQNGVAERKNRTLKEMMNAMLISSGLPQNL
ncbi:hypothetical protein AAC387_Pa03g2009 [Persea americana]